MKKNMGTADRVIRILLAALFAYLYFGGIVTGTWGLVLVILGGVFVLTSLVGFCPLYVPFGLSTCAKKST
jgi:fatty acid desaturase